MISQISSRITCCNPVQQARIIHVDDLTLRNDILIE